jgi:hypothetical protein
LIFGEEKIVSRILIVDCIDVDEESFLAWWA